ncbi:MAG: hypothetical protein RLY87_1431 [Chloroflexota bacterium]|jgi:hypothetical protein
MKRRAFLTLTPALLLLAACGGTREYPTDAILFPGAQPVDINAAALAAELQGGIDQYIKDLPKPSRTQLYRIPDDSTYVAVKEFYGNGLTPLGWEVFSAVSVEGDTLSYTAWRKGINIIIIGVTENVAGDGAYLLVVELP